MTIQKEGPASPLRSGSVRRISKQTGSGFHLAPLAARSSAWAALCLLIGGLSALGQTPAARPSPPPPPEDPGDLGPGYPRLDQPWGKGAAKQKKTKAPPKPAAKATAPLEAPTPAPSATTAPSPNTADTAPPADSSAPARAPRMRKNEISVSGDFLLGQGNVTLPFGFSLQASGVEVTKNVAKPDRSSTYFGGTISYSYGQA